MSTTTPEPDRQSETDDTQPDVVQEQQPEAPEEAARRQGDEGGEQA
jgi:hypothetical protein